MTNTEIVRPLFLTRACREMTQPYEHDLTTVQISSCRLQKQENPISDASHTSFLNYFMGYDGCKYITRMLGYKFMRLPYGRKQARLEDKNSGRPRQPACSPFSVTWGTMMPGKFMNTVQIRVRNQIPVSSGLTNTIASQTLEWTVSGPKMPSFL